MESPRLLIVQGLRSSDQGVPAHDSRVPTSIKVLHEKKDGAGFPPMGLMAKTSSACARMQPRSMRRAWKRRSLF
jgi:hypothetical protein